MESIKPLTSLCKLRAIKIYDSYAAFSLELLTPDVDEEKTH
jgi:hypothetical protein